MAVPISEHWVPLEHHLDEQRKKLSTLTDEQIPRVNEVASAVAKELAKAEHDLRSGESLLARQIDALRMEKGEMESITRRLKAIEEDIQRNQDIETLRILGSDRIPSVASGTCPVCHQPISDSLVPLPVDQPIMSVSENILFLKEQKNTFELVLENSRRLAESRERRVEKSQAEVTELRDRIRALRQTLIVDGRGPSIAAIRDRLLLEDAIHQGTMALDEFNRLLAEFNELADRWRRNRTALGELPSGDATTADREKLSTWSELFREQLKQYGFLSLPVEQLGISPDDYRPTHELDGFQLQPSISASDLIRSIWAYLQGMLEVSRSTQTNHPGFVVFDEPRQQSTQEMSFGRLLKRSSDSARFRQQVVFFTSETLPQLERHLHGLPHTLRVFPGRVLTKL